MVRMKFYNFPSSRGERNKNAKLTEAEVEHIRQLAASGMRLVDIHAQFYKDRCSVSHIGKIVRRENWQ